MFWLLMDSFLLGLLGMQTKSLAKSEINDLGKKHIYPKAAYCYREAVLFSIVVFDVQKFFFFLRKPCENVPLLQRSILGISRMK